VADRVATYLDAPSRTAAFVSQIENGRRAVTNRNTLCALAYALRVSITDLTGQPYEPQIGGDLGMYRIASAVRTALDEPDDPVQPRPIQALTDLADRVMAARMECDTAALGRDLPALLAETRQMGDGPSSVAAGRLFVQAAVTGSLALKPAGWVDLAVRLAERADATARTIGDPACAAAAQFALAQCALAAGNRRRSLAIATTAIILVQGGGTGRRMSSEATTWHTMLCLHAALTSASLHDAGRAQDYLEEAIWMASRVHGDPWRMECTVANAHCWAVGIALENGEPDRIPALVRQVDPNSLRTPHRRSRLFLDAGRAAYVLGDHFTAVRRLLAADQAAPGELRHRPSAVEVVAQMVRESPTRGGSSELQDLATRVGVNKPLYVDGA
jgi:transcriptional regulator with XRE-family HTH domain